jgi:hypothetical protein
MSEARLTSAGLVAKLIGSIIIVLGILLAYFSLQTDIEIVNTRFYTPIGIVVTILGGLILLAKEV